MIVWMWPGSWQSDESSIFSQAIHVVSGTGFGTVRWHTAPYFGRLLRAKGIHLVDSTTHTQKTETR